MRSKQFRQPSCIFSYPVILAQSFGPVFIVGEDVAENAISAHVLGKSCAIKLQQLTQMVDFPVPEAQVIAAGGPAGGKWVHDESKIVAWV